MSQDDLFQPSIAQQFAAWKATAGGRRVLQIAYALAARYARRYERSQRRVSMKLLWEILRDNVRHVRERQTVAGREPERTFALNNNFHALVARHILEHRPEWKGLFELRELGAMRKSRKVIVIEERRKAA